METLTSLKNPKAAVWRTLKDKKGRDEQNAFLVEGVRMVREALSSSFPIQAILLREDFFPDFSFPDSVPVYILSESVFRSVCDTKTPQGIAAVLKRTTKEASGQFLLALDCVQDPGNVGTMIRTADAAGFNGVIISPDCADLFSPKVLRSSMGSIFRLGFSFPDSLPDMLNQYRHDGYSVISSQLDGSSFYNRKNMADSLILVIGNEGNGISEPVKACATHHLCLPMRGGAESLNAAVAAGIMMYELTKYKNA